MEYRKLDEKIFGINTRDTFFLMKTFPFKIVKLDEVKDWDELKSIYEEDIKGEGIFEESTDYKYKGFFAMEWIMTSNCNLNCPHCFAHKKGEEGRYGLGKKALSYEELVCGIDKACMVFEEDIVQNELRTGEFQLFIIGGEPLLEFETMKKAIEYLQQKLEGIKKRNLMDKIVENYFMATNGLLINDEIATYLSNKPFTVSVSIDTPINPIKLDEHHTRKTEIAIRGVKKLLENGMKRIILNCVIPADKVYELDGIMKYIEQFGVMDKISGVQISPMTPPTRQTLFSSCAEEDIVVSDWSKDLDRCRFFAKKLIEYCKKYNTDMKKYHQRIEHMLKEGGMGYRCPVGQWKWCLVPGGEIYPCHQFVGISDFVMGNVTQNNEEYFNCNSDKKKMFEDRDVFKVKPCDECPLQSCCVVFIDCPGRAYLEGGDMYHIPEHQCLMAKEYLLTILEEFIWSTAEAEK